VPPDRLAINPRSPHFDADKLQRGIGIRFKGTVRNNVEEYCISEGWVRVQAGKTMDRAGPAHALRARSKPGTRIWVKARPWPRLADSFRGARLRPLCSGQGPAQARAASCGWR
jgi:hypothetical protein